MNENNKENILTSAFASKEDADKLSAEVIKKRKLGVNGQQENEEEMQQKNILTSAFANQEAADQLSKAVIDRMYNAQNTSFEKRKNELINEIATLEQEFSDINEKCIRYSNSINKFIKSVEYYETLPQRQKFNKKFVRNGYISVLACSLINVCFAIYTIINEPSEISIVLAPGILGYSSIYIVSAIKSINETSKKNKMLKKEEHEYKKTYEKQKNVIQVLKEVQNQLNDNKQIIQQQISNKKIDLFQLMEENKKQDIQPIKENIYQNPFKNECNCQDEHDNSKNEKNTLVKVRRFKKIS